MTDDALDIRTTNGTPEVKSSDELTHAIATGEQLREYRENTLKMSLRDFAKLIGVSPASVSVWETKGMVTALNRPAVLAFNYIALYGVDAARRVPPLTKGQLKAKRHKLNHTQESLAKALNLSLVTIRRYEQEGHTDLHNRRILAFAMEALKLKVDVAMKKQEKTENRKDS